jgi:hypothetical protein
MGGAGSLGGSPRRSRKRRAPARPATRAMASSLVGKKRPWPSALMVQGQDTAAPVRGSGRRGFDPRDGVEQRAAGKRYSARRGGWPDGRVPPDRPPPRRPTLRVAMGAGRGRTRRKGRGRSAANAKGGSPRLASLKTRPHGHYCAGRRSTVSLRKVCTAPAQLDTSRRANPCSGAGGRLPACRFGVFRGTKRRSSDRYAAEDVGASPASAPAAPDHVAVARTAFAPRSA